jgi:cytochrome c oxidase subunit 1
LGAGLTIAAFNLLASFRLPKNAPDNPWAGTTLEWQTQSPPITHNFEGQPAIEANPYDYRKFKIPADAV